MEQLSSTFKVPEPPPAPKPPAPALPAGNILFGDPEVFMHCLNIYNIKERIQGHSPQSSAFFQRDRVWVLNDTIDQVMNHGTDMRAQAEKNHQIWATNKSIISTTSPLFEVIAGDWADVTLACSKRNGGVRYVVLNMANPEKPGGHCTKGLRAQEENMYYRTNCFFYSKEGELLSQDEIIFSEDYYGGRFYTPAMQDLINAREGKVYLDTENIRTCFRGSEANGFEMLEPEDYFLFYEMRCAALYLKEVPDKLTPEIEKLTRQRITAIRDTLIANGQKYVVLGALGCGDFGNDPTLVARIIREVFGEKQGEFEHIVIPIFINTNPNVKQADQHGEQYMEQSAHNLRCFEKEFYHLPQQISVKPECVTLSFETKEVAEKFIASNSITLDGSWEFSSGTNPYDEGKIEISMPPETYVKILDGSQRLQRRHHQVQATIQKTEKINVDLTNKLVGQKLAQCIRSNKEISEISDADKEQEVIVSDVYFFDNSAYSLKVKVDAELTAYKVVNNLRKNGYSDVFVSESTTISFTNERESKQLLSDCGINWKTIPVMNNNRNEERRDSTNTTYPAVPVKENCIVM